MVSQMKSYSSSVTGLTGTLLSVAVFHKNHLKEPWNFFLTSPSEEEEAEERKTF